MSIGDTFDTMALADVPSPPTVEGRRGHPLRCAGRLLDQGPAALGELRASNELLGDASALRERMGDDGYLLLRRFLDPQVVVAARREILLKFAIAGEIDSIEHDVLDAVQSEQTFIDQVNAVALTESLRTGLAYERVVHAPELIDFFTGFLGGRIRSFDFRWPRLMRPGEGTGIHADGPYITRGTRNVWSAWIPLGDVDAHEGALAVLEHSHANASLRRSYTTRDADRDQIGWLSKDPVGLQRRLGGRWLTTDFRAGDVLLFGPNLVHAGLDNLSTRGRCRLSSDTRYQLASDPLDERWNGNNPNPHGGRDRVFLPGVRVGRGDRSPGAGPDGDTPETDSSNRDFIEEWKDVDRLGRLRVPGRGGR